MGINKPVELSEEYQSIYNRVSLLRSDETKLLYSVGEIEKTIMGLEMKRETIKSEIVDLEERLASLRSNLSNTQDEYNGVCNALVIAKQNVMSEEKKKKECVELREVEEKKVSELSLQMREMKGKMEAERQALQNDIAAFETRKSNLAAALAAI